MKRTLLICALLWAGCAAYAAQTEIVPQEDYLKLTRANMPSAHKIIDAAMKNLQFDGESLEHLRARARLSAVMPDLTLGAQVYGESVTEYGYRKDDYVTTTRGNYNGTEPEDINISTTSQMGAVGYKDRLTYSATIYWDLHELVVSSWEIQGWQIKLQQIDGEKFVYQEIAKRYAKLMSALPATAGEEIQAADVFVIKESAMILDSLSDYVLSDTLRGLNGARADVSLGDVEALKEAAKKTKKATDKADILEVVDGEDDGVERIGTGGGAQ